MRRKVGTTLNVDLYRRVKEAAQKQGRRLNSLIEEALERFLESETMHTSVVKETKGTFKVSAKVLRTVLEEDLYDAD